MTVWTLLTKAEKLDVIRERADAGMSGPQVAEEFGLTPKYVSDLAARAGVRLGMKPMERAKKRVKAPLVSDADMPVNDQIIDKALKRVDEWLAVNRTETGRNTEHGGDVGPASRALRDRLGNIAYVARCHIAHLAKTVGDINTVLDWLSGQGGEAV